MELPNTDQITTVFVGNLKFSVDNERLRREFAHYRTVIFVEVIRRHNRSRGFGLVLFTSSREAMNAVIEMNGRSVCGRSLYVEISSSIEHGTVLPSYPYHPNLANIHMNENYFFYQPRFFNPILICTMSAGPCLHGLVQIDPFTTIHTCLTPVNHFMVHVD